MPKITCGLEIHQQLNTKKLFSGMDSVIEEVSPSFVVERRQRAVVGETGEIDAAAASEAEKGKLFIYEATPKSSSLIELDEAPPNKLREEALKAALMIAKLTGAKVVDEVQVMRKTVVDGSNTSGFQRSALVAYGGSIESSKGAVSIPTIIVEEDSARNMEGDSERQIYRLDRLGIPLLEVSTGPDLHDSKQVQEVAERLGLLLRSTGLCKRGLGTIRQDVNVSVEGGSRVEIKGAQDLAMIPTLVEVEAKRQEGLLEIMSELKKRKIWVVETNISNVSDILKSSKSKVIASTLAKGGVVLGMRLVGFAGLLGKELQPNKRFGTELSDRAKVASGVGGLFHSDELPNYGITPDEVEMLKEHFKCGRDDAFILVADLKLKAEKALETAAFRAGIALKGVPKEVRRANPDGTTTFMRPMPGAARMYPETDVLPVRITKKLFDSVPVPELIEKKVARFERLGLSKDVANAVAKSESVLLFEDCAGKFKDVKPSYIAEILVGAQAQIRREFNIEINPSDDDYFALFDALSKGKIAKENVIDILKENKPVVDVLENFKQMSDADLKSALKLIVEKNKGLPFNALIGKAMAELRGKAPGQKIVELLKKLV